MTKEDVENRMTSAEFSWWLAREAVDPIPDSYWQAALIASTVAQAMGNRKAKLEHFLPRKKADRPRTAGLALIGRIGSIVERAEAEKARRNGTD